MNYIEIQKKILDNFIKNSTIFCQKVDDFYLISDNQYQIFKIPCDEMWLDIKKMMEDRNENTFLSTMLKIKGEDGVLTGEMKEIHDKKKLIVVKVSSENNSAWVDKKLIDRFKIKDGLHFTIAGAKHPILVWEHDEICGCICPVNVKG